MKRIALIACCCFAFGCGEDPEEGRPPKRAPDSLGLSRVDDSAVPDPEDGDGDGDDDDSTGGAQVCGTGSSDGQQGSSREPESTRPLVPAAPGSACTEGDESD